MKVFIYAMLLAGAAVISPENQLSAALMQSTGGQTTALTSSNVDAILNGNKPVVIKVYTDWCGPCKTLTPVYDQVANEYSGKYLFTTLDGDAEFKLVQKLGVKGYPTVIYFNRGQEVGRGSGAQSKAELVRAMTTAFGS